MAAEMPSDTPDSSNGRRATDTTPLKFNEAELKSFGPLQTAFAEGEIETINLDAMLPGGREDDFRQNESSSSVRTSTLTSEQKKGRIQLALFKQSFESFEVARHFSAVTMVDVKRGDVVAIQTIVGVVYLRVIDRIKGVPPNTGEILCECHYDLNDQCSMVHVASVQLPIHSRTHTFAGHDGDQRFASRQLILSTSATLPPHVDKLLHERFFVDISIYANPQPEKLRLVDIFRWVARMGHRLKSIIQKNNQLEREKKRKRRGRTSA